MAGSYERALWDTAELACDKAAEIAGQQLRSLSGGRNAFYPNVDVANSRISVGVVEKYHYLVYQDTGFETFVMTALRGKTIPIRSYDGSIAFRKATRINEFRPGRKTYWRRGADGELLPHVEQRRSWVHPGLPKKGFLLEGAIEATKDKAQDLYEALCDDLGI